MPLVRQQGPGAGRWVPLWLEVVQAGLKLVPGAVDHAPVTGRSILRSRWAGGGVPW